MKKEITMLLAALWIAGGAGETMNLIENPDFLPSGKRWYANTKNFSPVTSDGRNAVVVGGNEKPVSWQRIIMNGKKEIPPARLANHKYMFSVCAKVVDLADGCLNFQVRQIDKSGKTICYNSIKIGKFDSREWKEYKQEFTFSPQCAAYAIHITADYFEKNSKVLYRDLKLRSFNEGNAVP